MVDVEDDRLMKCRFTSKQRSQVNHCLDSSVEQTVFSSGKVCLPDSRLCLHLKKETDSSEVVLTQKVNEREREGEGH